jgi:hypothetical protein
VSQYNAKDLESVDSPFDVLGSLSKLPERRFFLVMEWAGEHAETTQRLAEWIKSGQIQYRESVVEGLDQAIDAFRGMLRGKNFGKQLVKMAD